MKVSASLPRAARDPGDTQKADARADDAQRARSSWNTRQKRDGGRVTSKYWPLGVAAFFGVCALANSWHVWAAPFRLNLGGFQDPPQVAWSLAWTPFALLHGHDPLVTNWIDYPRGINLMWNTSVVAAGVIVAPVTLALGSLFSYNLLAAAAPAIDALACYWAARTICGREFPAVAAGLIYGFSPFLLAQDMGHLHMALAFYPPLAATIAWNALVVQKVRPWTGGLLLGGLSVFQVLLGEEILFFSALIGLGIATAWAWHQRSDRAALLRGAIVLGTAATVLTIGASAPLLVQFVGPLHAPFPADTVQFAADPTRLSVPTPQQLVFSAGPLQGLARPLQDPVEQANFIGLPLAVLAFAGPLLRRRDKLILGSLLAAVLMGALSTGTQLHLGNVYTHIKLPWAAVFRLPGFRNALPSRLQLFVTFFLALEIALILAATDVRQLHGLAVYATAILGLLCLVPAAPMPVAENDIPGFFTSTDVLALPEGAPVLIVPWEGRRNFPMLWQSTAHFRFKMPAGYGYVPEPDGTVSLSAPPSWTQDTLVRLQDGRAIGPGMTRKELLRRCRAELRSWEISAVVLGPMPHRSEALQFVSEVARSSPKSEEGVDLWTSPNFSESGTAHTGGSPHG